jgi:ankyrin repeat protein
MISSLFFLILMLICSLYSYSQNIHAKLEVISPYYSRTEEVLTRERTFSDKPTHIQLIDALMSKKLDTAEVLLSLGADPRLGSPKHETNVIGEVETFYNLDDSALFLVIKYRYYEAVMLFIRHRVNWNLKNSAGMTPLLLALSIGDEAIAMALIHADADIFVTTNDAISPLIIASHQGMTAVVELLLKKAVLVDHKSSAGDTALSYAASGGHTVIIDLLIAHGGNISTTNNMLSTPLIIAASRKRVDAVKILLAHVRAKQLHHEINRKDASHRTAFDIAVSKGYQDIIDELASAGCDIGKRYVYISPEARQRRSQTLHNNNHQTP